MINIITIFIFLLVIGLSINTVRAGENYNSSKSNTATSIGIINRDVGNLLVDYGYGGEVVNQVTEALARGVTTDGLRAILSATSARSPAVVEEVLQKLEVELERLGMGIDSPEKEFTDSATPSATVKQGAGQIEKTERGVSTPDAGGAVPSASEGNIKDILPSKREVFIPSTGDTPQSSGFMKLGDLPGKRAAFGDSARKSIQDLKAAESEEESKKIRQELEANRRTFLLPAIQSAREILRENTKDLRDNFRENVKTTIGHVDHGKTGRVAVAHGKGLRMINRYRSAIARFDHILGRMESRIEKIGIENEAQARSQGTLKEVLPSEVVLYELTESAKNTQVLNKAKLAELEATYESLLTGKNPGETAEEARAIAKELKSEIEKLHDLLGDIQRAATDYNSSVSNSSSTSD